MTYNQFMGILRAIVPAGVAYLVGKGYIPDTSAADLGTAIIAVAAAIWSVISNIETKGI